MQLQMAYTFKHLFIIVILQTFVNFNSAAVNSVQLYGGNFGYDFLNQLTNLNKSESELPASCVDQIRGLLNALQRNELWAIKLIDAWGKIPSGILYGHLIEMGNFDECLSVNAKLSVDKNDLAGKYCLANLPLQQMVNISQFGDMLNLKIGICIPAACDADQLDVVLKKSLKMSLNLSFTEGTLFLKESSCQVSKKDTFLALDWVAIYNKFTTFIIFSAILLMLLLLMTLSTFYDYFATKDETPQYQLWTSFSIRSNMRQLLRINSNSNIITCLHGIRSMSIIWIIFGHCYMMLLLSPNVNALEIVTWAQSPFSMFLQSGTISVDTFFFLSGLLLVLVALRELDKNKGKLNVPLMYVHRYLRLTPVLALAVLIFMTLYRRLGSGPLWNSFTSSSQLCEETWWATLLYVQNYAAAGKMCLGHSWYLAVDTQLYVISPLVLITIWKWKRKGVAAVLVVGLLLFACLFSIIVINKLSVFDTTGDLGGDNVAMRKIYYSTHTRASPWIVGIVFGYFLHTKNGQRITLSKITVVFGWIVSLSLLLTVIFVLYPKTQPGSVALTPLEGAFYLSLSRVAWPLALCWIVLACSQGYGGPINHFLSWTFWQPISKLSYCMYLWHLLVESANAGRIRTNTHFSDYDVILRFWGDFGVTMFVSLAMYLAIEAPILGIEKFLFTKKPKEQMEENRVTTTVSQQNLIY